MITRDVAVIGGGPAGLAAAVRLYENGVKSVIVLEREKEPGGILNQCIHDGFGLRRFGASLTGGEYAGIFIKKLREYNIEFLTNALVTDISPEKVITVVTRDGLVKIKAKAVILAMGCRERTRGALAIPGERPAGVYTAGVAQAYINRYNTMVGREVVILGSGDVGLIMARRLTLEGAKVKGVYELNSYPAGLDRNLRQCLEDFSIPLYLSHTVVKIHGDARLEGVTVAQVDENKHVIKESETFVPCDTLILSVGLIPENELSKKAGVVLDPETGGAIVDENYMTTREGIFSAGNVLHVHDVADFVSLEAEKAADSVTAYLKMEEKEKGGARVLHDENIHHVVPQRFSGESDMLLSLRVRVPMKDKSIVVSQDGNEIFSKTYKRLVPSEMIEMQLSKAELKPDCDIKVSVR